MKIFVIVFPDGTDLSVFDPNDAVSVTKGTTVITDGEVLLVDGRMANPEVVLVPHTLLEHTPAVIPPQPPPTP